jgi:hypothetical protein
MVLHLDYISGFIIPWEMLVVQGVGFVGMIMNITSFQQNTNKRILGFQIIGTVLWCTHFLALGAYTGAALNFLGLSRNLVFFFRPKKWASSKLWLYFFCIAYIAAGVLTYESFTGILASAAMVLSTIALYIIHPKITRRISLASSSGWLTYNAISFSIAGVVAEILTITSIIIAMFKFDFKKNNE